MAAETYAPAKPCKRGHLKRYVTTKDCVECAHERHCTPEYRAQARASALKAYRADVVAARDRQRARRAKDPAKVRLQGREGVRRRKGLPMPTRLEPLLCECCGSPPRKDSLNLDHCHQTRTFRGWICHRCNLGIGMLGDNLVGLRRAVAYLERA